MVFVVAGRGEHQVDDFVTPISPGMFMVIHYNQVHAYHTKGKGLNIYNIYLDPQRHPLPDLGPKLRPWVTRLIPLHPELGHDRNRVTHMHFKNTTRLEGILAAMADESAARELGCHEAMRACFQLFLIESVRLMAHQIPGQRPDLCATDCAMENLRVYLDENYSVRLTLAHIAEKVNLSPNYLCRVFKRYTGRTVFQYLMQRRIEAAILQLTSTKDKVISIAYDCGFDDITHFNRTFRRLVGTTPREYRKRIHDSRRGC
jgi:AraC-like DNA-binding protein